MAVMTRLDSNSLARYLSEHQSDAALQVDVLGGELVAKVIASGLRDFVGFLKRDDNCRFATLVDITAIDFPGREKRFDVVYHFLSMPLNQRIRVKVALREDSSIHSISKLYSAADWFEREVFDMYGILFDDHPDLRRILTDYGFQGHPLRKDFPLTGYREVRYDEELKRVVYEPVKLVQEYRSFDFMSPWEGADYVLDNPDSSK